VVKEVENIRNRELEESLSEIERLVKKMEKLNPKKLKFSSADLGVDVYDLNETLSNKVDWINSINFENISQTVVVNRALKSIKPFTGQEKGYRDTLIWLSFLEYLKEKEIKGEVIFITNNKSDFFEIKNKVIKFHPELQKDIEEYGIKANITPYLNLYDFVNDKIDKDDHAIDKLALINELDDFFMEETDDYLEGMKNSQLSELFSTNLFTDKLTDVLDINVVNWDGVEDPEIFSVSKLSGNDVYISCYYEMRGINMTVSIDEVEYNQHEDEIESLFSFVEVEIDKINGIAKLVFGFRININASFIYDIKAECPRELSIEYFHL
jgi:hypothetical protein